MFIDPKYLDTLKYILYKISFSLPEKAPIVIAGGAIRDMLLEKEIADIDVFIEDDLISPNKLKIWFAEMEECEYGIYEDSSFNVKYKLKDKDIPVPIQIIQVSNVEEHINKFPTILSRVAFSKDKGLYNINPLFLSSALNKTVVFDFPVNYAYLNKMKNKFHDWEIIFKKLEYNPSYQHAVEF